MFNPPVRDFFSFLGVKKSLGIYCLVVAFNLTFEGCALAYQEAAAYKMADFILSLQDSSGAIKDTPEVARVNEDSNMEYALIGIAAAYEKNRDPKYLTSLERGIRWLAARETMDTSKWRGSWYYSYSAIPPYAPVPAKLGYNIRDVRGVDATSALFVYLLYLHHKVTGSDQLVNELQGNAKAALDFILANNQGPNKFFYSSWQLTRKGVWKLWKYQYTADQGDVYLGMRAGAMLYGDQRYLDSANYIQANLAAHFFDPSVNRYTEGLDVYGDFDDTLEFDMVFPQGYVPWVFGSSFENEQAFQWLSKGIQSDGKLVAFSGDPGYSLAVSIFGNAANSLGQPYPKHSLDWLLNNTYDSQDGSVRDEIDLNSDKYSNVAGLTILALLGQPPF